MSDQNMERYSNYTIGDMAKLLGVTAEAIRYYESKGIIKPLRAEGSGYRHFTTWDLHMLARARHYRQCGFSLEETAALLEGRSLEDVERALHAKEEEIQHEILWNINLLRSVRQCQQRIRSACEDVGVYRMLKSPGIYRINTQKCYTLPRTRQETELIREWMEKTPFVYSTAVFHKSQIEAGDENFDFGLGLDEEYAAFLGVEQSELVEYYPPCPCVYTCIPSRSSEYLSYRRLEAAFDYMRRCGLHLAGDIVTQVAYMAKPEEEYFNWHCVWIPVDTGCGPENTGKDAQIVK